MGSFRRTSFGLKQVVRSEIEAVFASRLVDGIRARDHRLDLGSVQIRLPRSFGLCHGVERAIQLAHETRCRFPQARLFLTDEMVHNPSVNARLKELGYRYLWGRYADDVPLDQLGPDDVVLLPAFGVETGLLELLRERNVQLVDTTCGEVMSVWKRVRQYAHDGFTTVIHGAPGHQETRATVSRAVQDDPFLPHQIDHPGAWVVVRDLADAEVIAAFVEGHGSAERVAAHFTGDSASAGFEPLRDLQAIGIANQTTMLARETLQVQRRLQAAFATRYGDAGAAERVRTADTICTATQDRQDALHELLAEPLGLLLVLGGYNSANTGHLVELARARGLAAFHLDQPGCLLSLQRLRQWDASQQREAEVDGWLRLPATVGIAAGASTPDARIGELIWRLGEMLGVARERLEPLMRAPPAPPALRAARPATPSPAPAAWLPVSWRH